MDILNRAYSQLVELFQSMTPGARLMAGLLTIAVLLGGGYFYTHQSTTFDVDLMHGVPLTTSQLPLMEAAFDKAKLKYEVRGTSIFVPRGQESACMAALVAAKALPKDLGAPQRDAIENTNPFDLGTQRADRMKVAKQEMLSRAICRYPGIETAWVEYDVPARSASFKEKTITAAVMIQPTTSDTLDAEMVSSIRLMVARAIGDLKPENVAVTDLVALRTWSGPVEPIRMEPSTKRAQVATPPVPPSDSTNKISEPTTVATPQDSPLQRFLPPELQDAILNWLQREWRTVGAVALGLIGLLVLRSMVRVQPVAADAKRPASSQDEATEDAKPDVEPAAVPAPHAKRFHSPGASLREELSALVEEDPDAAANVLRSWIGQVG
jgi:flagellar biosynthesis/type III secretory pathway M-ring protein FliF/YscJ